MQEIGSPLTREDLDTLLTLHRDLDNLLDEGMVRKASFEATLRRSLDRSFALLRNHEKTRGRGRSERIFAAFFDHFNDLCVVAVTGEHVAEPERELEELLKSRKLISDSILELKSITSVYQPDLITGDLKVHDEFLGAIILDGSGLDDFHQRFVELLAKKIDTDIYQNNRYTLEQLKINGIKKIDRILNSDKPLITKYRQVIKLLVESIHANAGYLVVPREGRLCVSARYLPKGSGFSLDRDTIVKISQKIVNSADENRFIPMRDLDIAGGEVYAMLLKTEQRDVEGVLILHHDRLHKGHKELAAAITHLIDSSLHMNYLFSSMFQHFLEAVGVIIDTLEPGCTGHTHRVVTYSLALGQVLNLSKLEMTELRIAAMLHNIDKIKDSPAIFRNRMSSFLGDLEREEGKQEASLLNSIISFDLGEIREIIKNFQFNGPIPVHRIPGFASGVSVLVAIIAASDIFDTLTTDRQKNRGKSREEALELMKARGGLLKEMALLLGTREVWEMISSEFQEIKIESLLTWYRREMIPDLAPLVRELETIKTSLEDIHRLRKSFDRGEIIDLMSLEDSLLSPSDKDLLIQREIQRNEKSYKKLLSDIENQYRTQMNVLEAKRNVETRFKEKFWDPIALEDLALTLTQANHDGVDMFQEIPEISQVLDDPRLVEHIEPLNVMGVLEYYLNESKKLKGLNDSYTKPLEAVKRFLQKL